MARTISGQFPERRMVEQATDELRAAGFDPGQMSIVEMEQEHLGPTPGKAVARFTGGSLAGIVIGAVAGAVVGLIVAALVSGSGRWTLVSALVCALAGACIGWLVVGLVASGVPIEEAEYRRERREQGRVLLELTEADAAEHEASAEQARAIMQRFGGRNVRVSGTASVDDRLEAGPDLTQGAAT